MISVHQRLHQTCRRTHTQTTLRWQ